MEQLANEGLAAMEAWMQELGLAMNIRELGATEDMIAGIAKATFSMKGGYKTLSQDEILDVFKASMGAEK